MTSPVTVLLVESDALELRERTEQLLMDGYAVDAVNAAEQARAKLAEAPDALVLSGGAGVDRPVARVARWRDTAC